MPSPLAHASLACFARSLLARQGFANLPRPRRWAFYALLGFALCAPDLDFALRLLPPHPLHAHGTFLHSLAAAVLFAPLFGFVAHGLLQRAIAWWRLALVGLLAYSAHLLMDMFTPGRGVMLLWPIIDQRLSAPLPLFVGAEHSDLWAWRWHLLTLTTELAFAGVVWLIARRLSLAGARKARPTGEAKCISTRGPTDSNPPQPARHL